MNQDDFALAVGGLVLLIMTSCVCICVITFTVRYAIG